MNVAYSDGVPFPPSCRQPRGTRLATELLPVSGRHPQAQAVARPARASTATGSRCTRCPSPSPGQPNGNGGPTWENRAASPASRTGSSPPLPPRSRYGSTPPTVKVRSRPWSCSTAAAGSSATSTWPTDPIAPRRDTGCIVIAVNYQKAPEHRFPVPLDDCYAGFRWTVEHADELGLDPSRIGVAGDSAGGNLAAAVCLLARERGETQPAAQVLIYPALDPSLETDSAKNFGEGYGLTTEDMRWSWHQYVPGESKLFSPLVAPLRESSLEGLAPAVVVTAEFDILRDEGQTYAGRLAAAGNSAVRLHYDGAIHGFLWMAGAIDVCVECSPTYEPHSTASGPKESDLCLNLDVGTHHRSRMLMLMQPS